MRVMANNRMNKKQIGLWLTGASLLLTGCTRHQETVQGADNFAGSASCRECHAEFYQRWENSHHGLAMQPVTAEMAGKHLTPHQAPLSIGTHQYRADITTRTVIETGPEGTNTYLIAHAMGGKNIYYFLTPLERGRLQVLPLAYDVNKQEWYDTTSSMVRHFTDGLTDAALPWRDSQLTFNTACFNCHVSQLSKNYDLKNDTYRTTWRAPGINCESCHGPGAEHIRVCKAAPTNCPPTDLKLTSMKRMTPLQSDETCATCHAKAHPITTTWKPADRFFDHFDLVTLEHVDFYPDGRDLGENYTYTLWLTSPCVQAGKLSCVHCHTSSGRYRFQGDRTNASCLPCHQQRVDNATQHTHHPAQSSGNQCIACHMPMTTFARMRRSDHSLRPPTPAATIAYKSPNACNNCHQKKDAAWADKHVRKWHQRDYQAPILHRASLIDAARKQNWERLDEMLRYLDDQQSDIIFVVSLLRLLTRCDAPQKWPMIRNALKHPHPLVRSAAAQHLAEQPTHENFIPLLTAARDEYRLVRVAAAASLVRFPQTLLRLPEAQDICAPVFKELENSYLCFPDTWNAHYNIGIYYEARGWHEQALSAYEQSMRLRSDVIPPIVNAAMLLAQKSQLDHSIALLQKAHQLEPTHAVVNLNLGMALAERQKPADAVRHLRAALTQEPQMAQAAYNLGVLLNTPAVTAEGLHWCRQAAKLMPQNADYIYSLCYYLRAQNQHAEAAQTLKDAMQRGVTSTELRALYQSLGAPLK